MLRRLLIENFQSHRRTEMELHPGVNALLGETDSGKSAVVRALRWLFFNEPRGEGFVCRGARECRVRAEFADGTVVERAREGGRNVYRVCPPGRGGEVYEGFGTSVPEEVSRATGVRRFEANGVTLIPNLANQMDPPFLVGESPATAAAVIGLVSRADVFDAALRGVNADILRLRREVRELEGEIAELDGQLRVYDDLPAWEEAVKTASGALEEARLLEQAGTRLEELAAARASVVADIEDTGNRLTALAGVGPAEALLEESASLIGRVAVLEGLAAALCEASEELKRAEAVLAATAAVREAASALEEAAGSAARLGQLLRLASEKGSADVAASAATATLEAASGVPEAESLCTWAEGQIPRLCTLVEASVCVGEARREAAAADQVLCATAGVPEAAACLDGAAGALAKADALRRLAPALAAAASDEGAARAAAQEAESRAKRAAEDISSLLSAAGRCPVCLSPVDAGKAGELARALAGGEFLT